MLKLRPLRGNRGGLAVRSLCQGMGGLVVAEDYDAVPVVGIVGLDGAADG